MKTHEFIRKVKEAGGVLESKRDDHYFFRLPNGERLLVPAGGKHTEARPYLVSKLKRLLRRSS
jgi:predicted RNA binding protein YcfA (HicA-like mRNA interferase family)